MTRSRTLLLDLDGTVVDSVPDLTAALTRLVQPSGGAPFAPDEVAPMVGDGVGALVGRALSARSLPVTEAAIARFVSDYTARSAELTRPYPGVTETLPVLAETGWRLAICTNKPEAATHALLAALGLAHWFAAVGGGDSFAVRKPDPAHLRATLAAAGGTPDAAVMVGDHANDVAAAAGAGVPCIYAGWGYGTPAMGAGAAALARSFRDLPDLAERLLDRRHASSARGERPNGVEG